MSTIIETDDELSPEEIQMVEERWEHYLQNPESAKSWEEVYEALKTKYPTLNLK